jgi:exoribonuclease R
MSNKNNKASPNKAYSRVTKSHYEEHLSLVETENLISEGRLFAGILRVNSKRRKVAYVTVPGIKTDILIEDEKARNRAIHGDLVAIELFDPKLWLPIKATSIALTTEDDTLINPSSATKEEEDDTFSVQINLWRPREEILSEMERIFSLKPEIEALIPKDNEIIREANLGLAQPKAKVVCILSKSRTARHVGALLPSGEIESLKPLPAAQSFAYFQPSDQKYPRMIVQRHQLPGAFIQNPQSCIQNIYVAEIAEEWPTSSKMPIAEKLRSLGEMGSICAETDALLIENGLNHSFYTDEMIEPLKAYLGADIDGIKSESTWEIPQIEIDKRYAFLI